MKKILVCFLFVFLSALFSGCHVEEAESSFPDVTEDASLGEESSSAESSEEVSYPVIPGLYECYLTGARTIDGEYPMAIKSFFPAPSQIEEYAEITELTINGVTYPCEYEKSGYYSTPRRTHLYRIRCDELRADVTVLDDMSIVEWHRIDIYKCGMQPDVLTFEEAEKLALDYASQVIDVLKYEYSTSVSEIVPREGEAYEIYCFSFSNSNPLYERDAMSISISAKGYVSDASVGVMGAYDDLPEDLIDEEKLEKTMLYYLEKLYPLYFEGELNGQYKFIGRDLGLTPEGDWVLENLYSLLREGEHSHVEVFLTVVLLDTNASGEESSDVS